MAKILKLERTPDELARLRVGRLHTDGSITFRSRRYRSLKEVPPECTALRPDVSCHRQWRAIWGQIDPRRRPGSGPYDSLLPERR